MVDEINCFIGVRVIRVLTCVFACFTCVCECVSVCACLQGTIFLYAC